MYAAQSTTANVDIVEELLQHRANINVQTEKGNTTLMGAAFMGHLPIFQKLL